MNSKELPSIKIKMKELLKRKDRVQKGMSPVELNEIFGGAEIKRENRKNKEIIFWRFMIIDASSTSKQYEIYMGEFEKNKLVFGAIIPHGAG